MKKHLGNLISWSSVFIVLITSILVVSHRIPQKYLFIAIVLALFLDFFDGKIARIFITKKEDFIFGEVTDSMCDLINFGIAPIILLILNFYSILIIFISLLYIWAILFRLARFSRSLAANRINNVSTTYYLGVPATISGPIVAFLAIILPDNYILITLLMLIIIGFTISNIKSKKI